MARSSDDERCARYRRYLEIDRAFRAGDLLGLRAALGHSEGFPNDRMPVELFGPGGAVLEYAIYHSPLAFVRALLEHGADPNPPPHVHAGFPPLLAALSCLGSGPGSTARPDVHEILSVLLAFGADPNQRGLNDWTPLHMAVAARSLEGVRILLEAGADPTLRTRIDDCDTPREGATLAGLREIADLLARYEGRRS